MHMIPWRLVDLKLTWTAVSCWHGSHIVQLGLEVRPRAAPLEHMPDLSRRRTEGKWTAGWTWPAIRNLGKLKGAIYQHTRGQRGSISQWGWGRSWNWHSLLLKKAQSTEIDLGKLKCQEKKSDQTLLRLSKAKSSAFITGSRLNISKKHLENSVNVEKIAVSVMLPELAGTNDVLIRVWCKPQALKAVLRWMFSWACCIPDVYEIADNIYAVFCNTNSSISLEHSLVLLGFLQASW